MCVYACVDICVHACIKMCVCVFVRRIGGEERGEDSLFMCLSLLHGRLFQNAVPQAGQSLAEESNRTLMGSEP